jgi:thiol-disulfide isomerase/thioredoxin
VRLAGRLSSLLVGLTVLAAQLVPLDGDGYVRMLQAHRGKVVLVDFWATWCDPCREELPKLVPLSKRLKVELITVSADEPEKETAAIAFLDKVGVRSPRYIKRVDDDQVFIDSVDQKWSGALPALFLYDASGVRVASFIGESDLDEVERSVRAHTAH